METSSIVIVVGGLITSLVMWLIKCLYDLINDLYKKHEDDSQKLQELAVEVAKNYNSKDEIQKLFAEMKSTIADSFEQLKELITIHLKK